MNVTLIDGATWSNPGKIDCLASSPMSQAELILGINPTDKAAAQACGGSGLASYVIPWLKALKLLLCVPQGMQVRARCERWLQASPTSAAVYPAYWDLAPACQGGILLQVLDGRDIKDAYAYTSCHYHNETTERFYCVHGTPQIKTSQDRQWRAVGWQDEVPPGVRHQLRVPKGELAITLIRMEGPHPLLNQEGGINLIDHHYSKW